MTSLVSEQFEVPSGPRGARRLDLARCRVVENLAGRTVWSMSALPEGRVSAERLGRHLDWTRQGGAEASSIQVPALEPLLSLARRLEAMLRGSARPTTKPGRADREVFSQGVSSGELLIGHRVALDDVVILHDVLAPALAHAVRGRGAHAVRQVCIGRARRSAMAAHAWTWTESVGPGPTRGDRVGGTLHARSAVPPR